MTTHQVSLGAVRAERIEAAARPAAGEFAFGQSDRAEPWQRRHLVASLALAAIGCLGMVVCWYAGAGKLTYDDQVPWLVGSITSAGVTVVGGVVHLVCGLRQVSMLERDLIGYLAPWLAEARAGQTAPVVAGPGDSLVIAAGMNRAHRPECLLVRGKADLMAMTAAESAVRGLPGCGVCGS